MQNGYYDGTTFHRVIPGFMIQGGDPKSRDRDPSNDGTGGGDPLPDEFTAAPYLRGVVGMGNRGRSDSTSAQFFIMHADNRNLDGRYNTIGRVLDGMDFVDEITRVAIDHVGRWGPRDRPIENVRILSVRPVGQVAAIRSAMELERQASGQLALAETQTGSTGNAAPTAADTPTGNPATPPAALAPGFDRSPHPLGGFVGGSAAADRSNSARPESLRARRGAAPPSWVPGFSCRIDGRSGRFRYSSAPSVARCSVGRARD